MYENIFNFKISKFSSFINHTGATQFDDMPDELREVVDDYWGTFPPQHPLIKDAFGVMFGLLFIISFFGNGCVLYVFLGTKSLRTPVSLFLLLYLEYLEQQMFIVVAVQLLHLEPGSL